MSGQNHLSLLNERFQKPNIIKPLFITLNSLAYLAYIITILAFIMSEKAMEEKTVQGEADDDSTTSTWLTTFYRVVSGVNGLCFFLLTVCLLTYGTHLKKIIFEIRIKGQHMLATNQLVEQMAGYSGASSSFNR